MKFWPWDSRPFVSIGDPKYFPLVEIFSYNFWEDTSFYVGRYGTLFLKWGP